MENSKSQDISEATVTRGAGAGEILSAHGVYHVECIGPDGELKWKDYAPNLITTQGVNSMLDTYFAGSAYTAAWKMSLITSGTATNASTYVSPTVVEVTSAIIAARLVVGWNVASARAKSATTTSFSIIGSATVAGNMVVIGSATVADTAQAGGVLFSAANFAAGSKTVSSGDTLNVTYSCSIT